MSSTRRPQPAPWAAAHPPDAPAAPATGTDRRLDLSATVAGFDGALIATVSRHDEDHPDNGITAVVEVVGDVDRDSAPLLHSTLVSAIDGNPRVCCDLSAVAFFGASGANTMLAAHWHASAAGRRFTVRGVHGLARRVFDITGLDHVLTGGA